MRSARSQAPGPKLAQTAHSFTASIMDRYATGHPTESSRQTVKIFSLRGGSYCCRTGCGQQAASDGPRAAGSERQRVGGGRRTAAHDRGAGRGAGRTGRKQQAARVGGCVRRTVGGGKRMAAAAAAPAAAPAAVTAAAPAAAPAVAAAAVPAAALASVRGRLAGGLASRAGHGTTRWRHSRRWHC